jgi:D-beta-D-heptose 7-phosphate kinase / D-beta-D-heptose 1-phosphate adenosyltransferase
VSGAPLVVVGDTLLDRDLLGRVDRLCPDAPVPVVDDLEEVARPGGAGLAAVLAAGDGRGVTLVTALSADGGGDRLRELLAAAGVAVVDLGLAGSTVEKVRVRSGGRSLLRLDRGEGGAVGPAPAALAETLAEAGAVLVSDYGRGVAASPAVRDALAARPRRAPLVWDPHPRGPEPIPGVTLATPNGAEARHYAGGGDGSDRLPAVTARARELADRWGAAAVSVTMSGRGALVVGPDDSASPLVVPAPVVPCPDPCGAGDRFASAAAGLLADGALPSEAVAGAVAAASAFVAAGGASSVRIGAQPLPPVSVLSRRAGDVIARTRAAGGTVVATGGCFDLLHAGHVAVLEQARALGDCLVVLLNSDDSVRRLKGADRPLVPAPDRAAVLAALGCVDAVAVFDTDTPAPLLEELQPDIFAKGGDYALTSIPEAEVVARWGGQAVVLPYLAGRSTTAMLEEAARRGARA